LLLLLLQRLLLLRLQRSRSKKLPTLMSK